MACVLVTAVGGCPEKAFPVAPVSGTVTINNKPVAGAKVRFQPVAAGGSIEAGGGSYATTDDQGRFTLKLMIGDGEGAVVGEHRVFITTGTLTSAADDAKIVGERVPRNWRDGEVKFTVPPGGTTAADFAIESSR